MWLLAKIECVLLLCSETSVRGPRALKLDFYWRCEVIMAR